MSDTPESHIAMLDAARTGWQQYGTELSRVRELEMPRPAGADVGYNINATRGFQQWAQTFQALEADRLTPIQNEGINRLSGILTEIRDSSNYLGASPSQQQIDFYTQQKMQQLQTTGETYMRTGHAEHFNIVKIQRLQDGGFSYTLYDAGHETRIVGQSEVNGQARVNAVEERRIRPNASIGDIIRADISKMLNSSASGVYALSRDTIENSLEPQPIRTVEDFVQTRNNCTTRGQRILFEEITGDQRMVGQLYDFITNPDITPAAIVSALETKAQEIRTGVPSRTHAVADASNSFGTIGWEPYKSGVFGQTFRYGEPFMAGPEGHTPEMRAFEEHLRNSGVAIQWGQKNGQYYAYVPESDGASTQRIRAGLGPTHGFITAADIALGLAPDHDVVKTANVSNAFDVEIPKSGTELGSIIAPDRRSADSVGAGLRGNAGPDLSDAALRGPQGNHGDTFQPERGSLLTASQRRLHAAIAGDSSGAVFDELVRRQATAPIESPLAALTDTVSPRMVAEPHGGGRIGAVLGAAVAIHGLAESLGGERAGGPQQPVDQLNTAAQLTSLGAAGAGVIQAGASTVIMSAAESSALLSTTEAVAGRAGVVGAVGAGALIAAHGIATGNTEEVAAGVGGTGGALLGAEIGATLGAEAGATVGAFFGGVGAAPGAAIGGVVGGVVGGVAGSEAGQAIGHEAMAIGLNIANSDAAKATVAEVTAVGNYVAGTAVGKAAIAVAEQHLEAAKVAVHYAGEVASEVGTYVASTAVGREAIREATAVGEEVVHDAGAVGHAVAAGARAVVHSRAGQAFGRAAVATGTAIASTASAAWHATTNVAHAVADSRVGRAMAPAVHAVGAVAHTAYNAVADAATRQKDYWIGNDSYVQSAVAEHHDIPQAWVRAHFRNGIASQDARNYLIAHGQSAERVNHMYSQELGQQFATSLSRQHAAETAHAAPAPRAAHFQVAGNVSGQLEQHGFKPSMDKNHDGHIDINEIRATFRQHGLTVGQVDANHDGIATAAEVSGAINAAVTRSRGAGRH